EVQIGDAGAVIGRADLGVAAEIADEDHLVDAASHGVPLMPICGSLGWGHLIKPGGCSYFILIPAIHRVSTHLTLAPGRPGEDNALTRRTQRDTPRMRSGFGSAGLVHNEAARQ